MNLLWIFPLIYLGLLIATAMEGMRAGANKTLDAMQEREQRRKQQRIHRQRRREGMKSFRIY